jgi:hypothetical protein
VTQNILKTLENKGINVPEHHNQPLLAQWKAFQQLRSSPGLAKLVEYDIGLKHVPGGDHKSE